jgi:dimethylargininase
MDPKLALVRAPGTSYHTCLSSHPLHPNLDIKLARKQHAEYCKVLKELGIEVIHIPPDDKHPDACFIEDNAIINNDRALISRMGAISRRGEEIVVENILKEYKKIKRALAPATVEGGDVIHINNERFTSGITQRTNQEGIMQMENWLGVHIGTCCDPTIMHLKTFITYLKDKIIISTSKYATHPILEEFDKIIVDKDEEYSVNTLTIGDSVLMTAGFPKAHTMVKEKGFDIIILNMSEFQKCDGALTCLSLLL